MDFGDLNKSQKEALLGLFKNVISFLNDNGITWWAAYGTLLGAVRHKGLIPWDDDVDLWVPREDYERLLGMGDKLSALGMTLCSPENNADYYLGFAKICDNNTSVWEHRILPCRLGVYVDIFPLDETNRSVKEINELQVKYDRTQKRVLDVYARYGLREYLSVIRHFAWKTILDRIRFRWRRKYVQEQLIAASRSIGNSPDGRFLSTLWGTTSVYDYYDKKWFAETIEVGFEDFVVRIPADYDNILTSYFGDWRTPPPEECRSSAHEFYYLNLKQGLAVEEMKLRIRAGEKVVY